MLTDYCVPAPDGKDQAAPDIPFPPRIPGHSEMIGENADYLSVEEQSEYLL